jgi:hypothetical protein
VIPVEPDQLRIRAGARRKALRSNVKRLEQVRLAGPVRPDGKDQTGRQLEIQSGVRAEVAERDLRDDQPASLIGMIRYEKASSGE